MGYAIAGIGALLLPIVLIKNVGRGAYGVYSYVTLLLTQAYLLLGGLGEALAYFLANYRQEAIYWIRGALGAALLMGALGLGLWQWRGPEILTALLAENFIRGARTYEFGAGGISSGGAFGLGAFSAGAASEPNPFTLGAAGNPSPTSHGGLAPVPKRHPVPF